MKLWISCLTVTFLSTLGSLTSRGQQPVASVMLRTGQAIPLRLLTQISSLNSKPGDEIPLEARADVVVNGRVVVRRGAHAKASVVVASQRRKFGQGGRLGLQLKSVTLSDGETLPLDSGYKKGGGGLGQKTYKGLAVASIVLISPAGMAFLLLNHGQEILLPEGTAMEGFVGSDTPILTSKMEIASSPLSGSLGPNGAPKELEALPEKQETLAISTSVGDGSVWIDRVFRGEAPLAAEVTRGMHTVVVDRDGYKEWREKVLVEGDGLKMKADLMNK